MTYKPIILLGEHSTVVPPYRIARDVDSSFVVGRNPGGISAVVLRRGGSMRAVRVATLIKEGRRILLKKLETLAKKAAAEGAAMVTKPKKRKGAKKR